MPFYLSGLISQSCCSGGVPVSSNLGFQSTESGMLQYSIGADFSFLRTLKNGSNTLDDDQGLRTTQSYLVRSAYSFSDRFSAEIFLPFVRQTRRITSLLGNVDRDATFGIGDPVLLGFYKLVNKSVIIRIGAGPQIPLGSTQQRNSRGLILLEDLQPGSGAWDLISMVTLEFLPAQRPTAILFLNTIYSQTGVNDQSRGGNQTYEFGNDLQVISGYSEQIILFNRIINPGINLRYRWADRDQVDSGNVPGTGGQFLFTTISLGIPTNGSKSDFNVNLELPLWTKVNETQLAPTFRINFGWSSVISTRKEEGSIPDTF